MDYMMELSWKMAVRQLGMVVAMALVPPFLYKK